MRGTVAIFTSSLGSNPRDRALIDWGDVKLNIGLSLVIYSVLIGLYTFSPYPKRADFSLSL